MARKLTAKTAGDTPLGAAAAPAPKKRGRPPKILVESSNTSDSTIQEACAEAHSMHEAAQSAHGAYRACLKKWEERGVRPSDIAWYIRTKKREIADVDAETKRRSRIAALMGMPIGAQLGLFESGETVAHHLDSEAIAASSEGHSVDWRAVGHGAGLAGAGAADNPNDDGSPAFHRWEAGRRAGQKELAEKTFKSAEQIAGETIDEMKNLREQEPAGAA